MILFIHSLMLSHAFVSDTGVVPAAPALLLLAFSTSSTLLGSAFAQFAHAQVPGAHPHFPDSEPHLQTVFSVPSTFSGADLPAFRSASLRASE